MSTNVIIHKLEKHVLHYNIKIPGASLVQDYIRSILQTWHSIFVRFNADKLNSSNSILRITTFDTGGH